MRYALMDNTDRIAEAPTWWLNGIPRNCVYHPHEATVAATNILLRSECQFCCRAFLVAIGTDRKLGMQLSDLATGHEIEDAYVDPPFHLAADGYNCAGNSMLMIHTEVLQLWEQRQSAYVRRPQLEGTLPANF